MNCIGATSHRQKSGRKPLSARLRGERGVPAWLRREDEVGSSAVRDGAPPPHPDPLRPQGQLIPRIRALVAKDDAASVKIRANRLGSGEVRRSVAAELSDGSVSNKSKPTRCPRCDGKPDIAGPEREGRRSTRFGGSARRRRVQQRVLSGMRPVRHSQASRSHQPQTRLFNKFRYLNAAKGYKFWANSSPALRHLVGSARTRFGLCQIFVPLCADRESKCQ